LNYYQTVGIEANLKAQNTVFLVALSCPLLAIYLFASTD